MPDRGDSPLTLAPDRSTRTRGTRRRRWTAGTSWPWPARRRRGGRGGLLAAAGPARRDRALRPPPEQLDAGHSAHLRDGDGTGRRGDRPARHQPRGPADQDRGQPRPPGQPRRVRPLLPGGAPRPLRPRPLEQVIHRGTPPTWDEAVGAICAALEAERAQGGAGLRVLTGAATSPTLAAPIGRTARSRSHEREVGAVRAVRQRGRRGRGGAGGRSASRSSRSTTSRRPTSCCRSTPTSSRAAPGTVRYQRDFADRRRVRRRRAGHAPTR